jgi:hypothetical protein
MRLAPAEERLAWEMRMRRLEPVGADVVGVGWVKVRERTFVGAPAVV